MILFSLSNLALNLFSLPRNYKVGICALVRTNITDAVIFLMHAHMKKYFELEERTLCNNDIRVYRERYKERKILIIIIHMSE